MPLITEMSIPWLAKFQSGYVIHGYEALKELAFMDDQLEMRLGGVVEFYQAEGTPWARFMEEVLQSHHGPEHTRLRASVAEAFTPRRAKEVRPKIREVVSALLDQWTTRGEFDFADFTSFYPVGVMCRLQVVSADPIPQICDALEDQMASLTLDPALRPRFMAGYETLWNFADSLIMEREDSDDVSDALLDALISAKNTGKMDDTGLRHMLIVLLVGGYDSSKNMLGMTMYLLLQHPEYWQRCTEDLAFCGKVIEETLRH